MKKPRVLHCITAYNGASIVPRAIRSALAMDRSVVDFDVLILDDASPDKDFSANIKTLCNHLGVMYYCTPRNLGIPRNVSLGMLTAVKGGYDYMTINNSDVIFGKYVLTELYLAITNNENVGSVTGWSNNVSIYSIPNDNPDKYLATQNATDQVGDTARELFSGTVVDIPAGISFCLMIPTKVIEHVGVMDPVYGRGYCEETDWSLRSLAMGYRCCLAPAAFTYHQGYGSNMQAGLITAGQSTVPEHEAIVDLRYPYFRDQVDDFFHSNPMPALYGKLNTRLIENAIAHVGYEIDVSWLPLPDKKTDIVTLTIKPEGAQVTAIATYLGFKTSFPLAGPNYIEEISERFGSNPIGVNMFDRGTTFDQLANEFGAENIARRRTYPSQV